MSNDYALVIQARVSSRRFPSKVLTPLYGKNTLLDIVIDTAVSAVGHDKVWIATSTEVSDDEIESICERWNVHIHRGSLDDVLARFVGLVEATDVKALIRICADNPFLQGWAIRELIQEWAPGDEYLSFAHEDGTPSILGHSGLFAEMVGSDALRRAFEQSTLRRHREHPTTFHLENGTPRFLRMPGEVANRYDIRLTLDTPADYEILSELYKKAAALKVTQNLPALIALIDRHPAATERMAELIADNMKVNES
jgi:spore coat polysaccharide biosynthesis protein SpsF